ncbi:MAG: hypothetical protein DCC52_16785 [Chloroflexi bacterium]|nr:MAG: hypothetical protein DCC52_16785 [Chloroflexota bacterium]
MFAVDGVRGRFELALAEKDFAGALSICENLRAYAERTILRQYLSQVMLAQAQALRGLERWDEAAQARALAEEINARWSLWQILATFSQFESERGDVEKANLFRTQARELIESIAARTPETYRARFMTHALQAL